MTYLNREDLVVKLEKFGIKPSSINRLIREQNLPAHYFSPRRSYFVEQEIDLWLSRRSKNIVVANATHAKILRKQRQARATAQNPNAILAKAEKDHQLAELKAETAAMKIPKVIHHKPATPKPPKESIKLIGGQVVETASDAGDFEEPQELKRA